MSWYLGVDAGGSFTRAALFNPENAVLCEGHAGPGNPFAVAPQVAFQAIEQAVAGALGQAACHPHELSAACIGVAGIARLSPPDDWMEAFADWQIPQLEVVSDLEIAHYASFQGQPGIQVIAGTGSSVLVKDAAGQSHVYGGWGWLLGDEGSAVDLGRSAVQWLTEQSDAGRPIGALGEAIFGELAITSASGLVPKIYADSHPRQVLARLAPILTARVAGGDPAAVKIMEAGIRRLVGVVVAAAKRLPVAESQQLAFAGGVFRSEAATLAFQNACARAGLRLSLQPRHISPLGGAVMRAAGIIHSALDPRWVDALSEI